MTELRLLLSGNMVRGGSLPIRCSFLEASPSAAYDVTGRALLLVRMD